MDLKALIREIPDFPQPGISFKDISTVIGNAKAFHYIVEELAKGFRGDRPEVVVGIESRGYIIGAPLAYALGAGFILVRKPGKLPAATERIEYTLEYGENALEIHKDAIRPGQRVLIVDDILATGGTVSATAELVRRLGGEIIGYAFLAELDALQGRAKLTDAPIISLVHYED
ncbi:MAG: adenine phosphoribosyltransferase [Firmicutes bacterium]|nr:adenine phosphoribosyltransferase [Bacillota bacterium]